MIARIRGSEQEIRKINAILDTQQENSPEGILVVGDDHRVLSCNSRFARMWEVPTRLLEQGDDPPMLQHVLCQTADPEGFIARVSYLYDHPQESSREEIALRDGRVFDRHSFPMRGKDGTHYGRVWYFRDITDQKRTDLEVRRSLREKETLLKEVHHRVKNNLQAVSGILDLQVAYLPDGDTARILRESKDRIHTMALLHEKLCMGSNQTHVDLREYLSSLTRHLKASMGVREEDVTIREEIEDLELNLDTAIPCGLIVTELVTNSLKYAFPGRRPGVIGVRVSRLGSGNFQLVVGDDGIGLSPDLDLKRVRSLGLHLVSSLVEQLSGTIELRREGGTTFIISFREYAEYQGAL